MDSLVAAVVSEFHRSPASVLRSFESPFPRPSTPAVVSAPRAFGHMLRVCTISGDEVLALSVEASTAPGLGKQGQGFGHQG